MKKLLRFHLLGKYGTSACRRSFLRIFTGLEVDLLERAWAIERVCAIIAGEGK